MQTVRHIYDYPKVKGVRAWALMFGGKFAGKIIAHFSDNPMGSVCTAQAMFFGGPLAAGDADDLTRPTPIGKAGGYGYDKFSAAVNSSFRRQGIDTDLGGRGAMSVRAFLEEKGYTVFEVI